MPRQHPRLQVGGLTLAKFGGDPPTPAAAQNVVYTRESDSKPVVKDAAGVEYDLTAAGGGAPSTVDYLVRTADAGLSAERVVTDTASIVTDWGTAGQAKLNVQFGSTGTVACVGNDARLSDARTPTAHATSHQPGGGDAMAVDAAAATGSLRTLGTGATQAAAGDDARITAAMTHPQVIARIFLGI